jgi:hypothetical protein
LPNDGVCQRRHFSRGCLRRIHICETTATHIYHQCCEDERSNETSESRRSLCRSRRIISTLSAPRRNFLITSRLLRTCTFVRVTRNYHDHYDYNISSFCPCFNSPSTYTCTRTTCTLEEDSDHRETRVVHYYT